MSDCPIAIVIRDINKHGGGNNQIDDSCMVKIGGRESCEDDVQHYIVCLRIGLARLELQAIHGTIPRNNILHFVGEYMVTAHNTRDIYNRIRRESAVIDSFVKCIAHALRTVDLFEKLIGDYLCANINSNMNISLPFAPGSYISHTKNNIANLSNIPTTTNEFISYCNGINIASIVKNVQKKLPLVDVAMPQFNSDESVLRMPLGDCTQWLRDMCAMYIRIGHIIKNEDIIFCGCIRKISLVEEQLLLLSEQLGGQKINAYGE